MGWRHALVGRVASCVLVTSVISVSGCDSSCNSMPAPQFNVGGITYVYAGSAAGVSDANLGDVVATITAPMPESAYRCELFTLGDGQGTLAVGTDVYMIKGVDRSSALAAWLAGALSRFDAR